MNSNKNKFHPGQVTRAGFLRLSRIIFVVFLPHCFTWNTPARSGVSRETRFLAQHKKFTTFWPKSRNFTTPHRSGAVAPVWGTPAPLWCSSEKCTMLVHFGAAAPVRKQQVQIQGPCAPVRGQVYFLESVQHDGPLSSANLTVSDPKSIQSIQLQQSTAPGPTHATCTTLGSNAGAHFTQCKSNCQVGFHGGDPKATQTYAAVLMVAYLTTISTTKTPNLQRFGVRWVSRRDVGSGGVCVVPRRRVGL